MVAFPLAGSRMRRIAPMAFGNLALDLVTTVLETDLDLAGYLLEEARCAVVPGTAFGSPGFVRMSYAASNDMIREGLNRIGEAVSKLS